MRTLKTGKRKGDADCAEKNFHVSNRTMTRAASERYLKTRNLSLGSLCFGVCIKKKKYFPGWRTRRVRIFIVPGSLQACPHIYTTTQVAPKVRHLPAVPRGTQTSIEIEQSQWGWNAMRAIGAFAQWQKAHVGLQAASGFFFLFFLSLLHSIIPKKKVTCIQPIKSFSRLLRALYCT